MDYSIALLVLFMGLCPITGLLCAGLTVVIMLQLRNGGKHKWYHIALYDVRAREFESRVRDYLDDGWTPIVIVKDTVDKDGRLDVHLRKYI